MSLEDSPEFKALCQLAQLDPEKLAAACADPEHFFEHISIEELTQLKEAATRLGAVKDEIVYAFDVYTAYGKGLLRGLTSAD